MQACSRQYFADCQELFGCVYPHDDSVNNRENGGKLDQSWVRTQVIASPPSHPKPGCSQNPSTCVLLICKHILPRNAPA